MAKPWQPRELSTAFVALRAVWISSRPFPHFLAGAADAPTYGVELDLDHARSYIASMFEQFVAGSPYFRFEDRIAQDGEELNQLAARLATVQAPEVAVEPLRQYVAETASLLAAFATEVGASASSSRTPF